MKYCIKYKNYYYLKHHKKIFFKRNHLIQYWSPKVNIYNKNEVDEFYNICKEEYLLFKYFQNHNF